MQGEDYGESGPPPLGGEGRLFEQPFYIKEEIIRDKSMSFEEASKCLSLLGKDESGCRYAYLSLTANDMKLTDVSVVLNFKHVLFLDVSRNYLTMDALQVITAMPFLILLKAERNRIESPTLNPMPFLQILCLNENQIASTLDVNQPLLDCLELNYNNIFETDFTTSKLDNLKELDLRSNLLFQLAGNYPPSLEKLYLAANKIANINETDLAKLQQLETLHLRDNLLKSLDGFTEHLAHLKYLNLRSNKIRQMREFLKLKQLPALETLIVTGNPLAGFEEGARGEGDAHADFGEGGGEELDSLVVALLAVLPGLKRVNKVVITAVYRIRAEDLDNAALDAIYYGDDVGGEEEEAESDADATTANLTSEYQTESESERPNDEPDE